MENENGDSLSKMAEYEVLEQIGRGAFGAVFLVLHKTQNKRYVLKKIRLSKHSEKLKSTIYEEMELIAKLDHPYIIGYRDAWVDKGSCICIADYCEGADISAIVRNARGQYFSEEKLCKWLTQLLLALDYLHSNRILHRDLKLSNIFVTKENDIRLGDFGLAKLLNEKALASSDVGTPNYMCPEVLADMPYGYKSDIWSLGCCLFEIAAHQQAFRAPDMAGLVNKINRSLISPMPIVYSSSIKQIIKSMLRKSPEHRPTAAELLRHPHLQPFLLRCHNPSTVFLPVKSPSPTNSKEKSRKPSPAGSLKDHREREVQLKQRELLPLFDQSTNVQYMNLLDDFVQIEEKLETKRVDPTSYSGKISHDSEDSKSGDTSLETTASNGDHHHQDHFDSLSMTKERISSTTDSFTLPSNAVSEAQVKPNVSENMPSNEATEISEANTQQRNSSNAAESSGAKHSLDEDMPKVKTDLFAQTKHTEKEVQELANHDELLKKIAAISDQSKDWENPGRQRADALESLLELCARLVKQDKFDELSGVLKPFGDDAVSSRETAIWLTKSLMNVQKFPKQS